MKIQSFKKHRRFKSGKYSALMAHHLRLLEKFSKGRKKKLGTYKEPQNRGEKLTIFDCERLWISYSLPPKTIHSWL